MLADDRTRLDSDPSPQAIAEACSAIRATWSDEEFYRRSTHYAGPLIGSFEQRHVELVMVSTADLRWAERE